MVSFFPCSLQLKPYPLLRQVVQVILYRLYQGVRKCHLWFFFFFFGHTTDKFLCRWTSIRLVLKDVLDKTNWLHNEYVENVNTQYWKQVEVWLLLTLIYPDFMSVPRVVDLKMNLRNVILLLVLFIFIFIFYFIFTVL